MMRRGRGSFALVHSVIAATLCLAGVSLTNPPAAQAVEVEPLAARQAAARSLVEEALQREIYGPQEERQALLEEAAERDRVLQAARWHQGLVQLHTGAWVPPEQFRFDNKSKRLWSEYRQLRDGARDSASVHLSIANWCAEREMPEQERAHLWRVVTLDPDHAEARRRLGHVRVDGAWYTADEAEQVRAAIAEYQAALAKFQKPVEEIAHDLEHRSAVRREAALKRLDELSEEALPAIEEVLGRKGGDACARAIEKIARFSKPEAALALCRFALFASEASNRQLAATKLRNCKPQHYVPPLLSLMSLPLQSTYVAVAGPGGVTNYQHVVMREGQKRRDIVVANQQYMNLVNIVPIAVMTKDPKFPGRRRAPILAIEQAQRLQAEMGLQRAAATTQERERQIAEANAAITKINQQVMNVLTVSTQQQFIDPQSWWDWWTEEIDRQPQGKFTNYAQYNQTQYSKANLYFAYSPAIPSCFVAGTEVWTVDGLAPIESLQVGDLVLSKDLRTGELAYKPVLQTTIRPPSPIVTFKAGDDTFHTSRGHLFWQSGVGWTQSRRLTEGMILHTASDPVRVSSIGQAPPQPTYNLVVADFNTYFVGKGKVLTHDVTEEQPVDVAVPGLTQP